MKMRFEVNKVLLPMKAHYFLWNAGTGPVVPFLSIYARQLGFSSVIVGLIYTILPVFGMIAKPVFGALADRFLCQKRIFLIAQLVTAAAFLAVFYAPKVPIEATVKFSCVNSEAVFRNDAELSVDRGLLKQIQGKNILAQCELNCYMTSKDLTILCKDWKLTEYCALSSEFANSTRVSFLSSVPMAKTLLFPKTFQKDGNTSSIEAVVFRAANITVGSRVFNPICPSDGIKATCMLGCSDNDINNLLTRNEIKDSDVYGMYQFWAFLLLMIVSWCGQAVAVSIGDAICFEMLGDKPNRYGYQRMYGALGWGLLSLTTGVLIDYLSIGKSYTDYTAGFYLGASFLILDFCVCSTIKYNQTKMSTNIFKDIGKLLVNVRIIVFLVWCSCVGMCTGLIWQFLLWLVEDLANGLGQSNIKTLQGVIMGVQCLGGELPFFFLSGKILKKIGHVRAMSLVLFALGIRFILYSVIKNPWWFIPIEFSNGLTFGLFYACMASYASIVAPPGTEATMQGMVGAVFEGVGVSLGSFLGGLAWSKVKGSMTFQYFGIAILAACVVHIVAQYLLQVRGKPNDKNVGFDKPNVNADSTNTLSDVIDS